MPGVGNNHTGMFYAAFFHPYLYYQVPTEFCV